MFMRVYDFGTPYAALFDRCAPRQRPWWATSAMISASATSFYAPEDQAALWRATDSLQRDLPESVFADGIDWTGRLLW
jgi:hypothetical protein